MRQLLIRIGFLCLILGLTAIVFAVGNTTGKILIVDDDGEADFAVIQDAVDAADPGDTIRVYNGTYNETVDIDKTLSLIGNSSAGTIIIRDGNIGVSIQKNGVSIRNFGIIGKGESTGIYAWVDQLTVKNCSITGFPTGIYVRGIHNLIESSSFQSNMIGVMLNFCEKITLKDNQLTNNDYGCYIDSSEKISLLSNSFENNGIYMWGRQLSEWNTHEIPDSNTVNGKPIHYLKNESSASIPENSGQIILVNCESMIIENHKITNATTGIFLAYCVKISVINNTCSNNSIDGIQIIWTEDCTVLNNSCIQNGNHGIKDYASNNNITGNTLAINYYGLYLGSDNIVSKNVFSHNTYGLYITGNQNEFWNNTSVNNQLSGVYLDSADDNYLYGTVSSYNGGGFSLSRSDDNIILNGSINENDVGIWMDRESYGNEVHYNSITNSDSFGARSLPEKHRTSTVKYLTSL